MVSYIYTTCAFDPWKLHFENKPLTQWQCRFCRYLEEAIMNLDTANPVTKEHMPAVLGHLCQNLTAYIHANPNDQMTRNMRILQMAAQSLLK